eukprot:scaffold32681_cov60-Cyclotella_meneghiniana.AAC.2
MGHHVEIFTSPPPDSCICAVCHDVLKDAVGINCGHSFCEECAKVCLPTKACPNCRADFTSYAPNFTAREFIGSMEVRCIHGHDEQDEEMRKRARGNDGAVVVAEWNGGCRWTGKCQDLQTHENTCQFKIVTCSIDGCNHECPRKDIAAHLSGDGFVHHMNLMKQSITASYKGKLEDMKTSYENKMEEMKQCITSSYENKVEDMRQSYDVKICQNGSQMTAMKKSLEREKRQSSAQIKSFEKKIKVLETKVKSLTNTVKSLTNTSDDVDVSSEDEVYPEYQQVTVDGCGMPEINGVYKRDGIYDGVPCYSKPGQYEGNEVVYKIYQQYLRWWISILPPDPCLRRTIFYYNYSFESPNFPPQNGWVLTGSGINPAPNVKLVPNNS